MGAADPTYEVAPRGLGSLRRSLRRRQEVEPLSCPLQELWLGSGAFQIEHDSLQSLEIVHALE
jgi:hypothetical protein